MMWSIGKPLIGTDISSPILIPAMYAVGRLVHETGARATDYDADRGIRALRAARATDGE